MFIFWIRSKRYGVNLFAITGMVAFLVAGLTHGNPGVGLGEACGVALFSQGLSATANKR